MTEVATPTPPVRRPRNRVGTVGLVLALLCAVAPLIAWIAVGVSGAVEYPDDRDNAIYVGVLGGMIVFFGVISLLSPLSLVAAILGVVSFWRPGSKAPGIAALVLGLIGALGLVGLPVVLGEIVPGF
jgi:hypothetical protein